MRIGTLGLSFLLLLIAALFDSLVIAGMSVLILLLLVALIAAKFI